MANYLATNEKAGTGAIMTVSIDFKGVDPDVGSGAVPYINVADVKAEIVTPATQTTGESSVAVGLTNIGPTTFRTNAAIPLGKVLRIYRASQDAYGLVQFQALQNVTEKDLDLLARQILYVSMETKDLAARAVVAAQYSDTLARLALTTAGSAVNTASQAVQTANAAVLAAGSAVQTANEAYTRSNTAIQTANSAVANVQDAVRAANEATAAAHQATQDAHDAVQEAQDIVNVGVARFLQPADAPPLVRDNGQPLVPGDRYYDTTKDAEYIYTGTEWVANDSLVAVDDLRRDIRSVEEITQRDRAHYRSVYASLPVVFPDYVSIQQANGNSYLYPQGFYADEARNEFLIAYNASGGVYSRTVVVYDATTLVYKGCFSLVLGSGGGGESFTIVYKAGTRYLVNKYDDKNVAFYNITTQPANRQAVSPAYTRAVPGIYFQLSSCGNVFLIEDTGPTIGGAVARTTFGIYDMDLKRVRTFHYTKMDSGFQASGDNALAPYIPKAQGVAVGRGFIATVHGGIRIFADASTDIPFAYQGARLYSTDGHRVVESICYPEKMRDILVANGYPTDRLEYEGLCVTDSGKVLSIMVNNTRFGEAGTQMGILILREFSPEPDAIDFSSAVVSIPGSDLRAVGEMYPRSSGSLMHPVTGQAFTSVDQVLDCMVLMQMPAFAYNHGSTPLTVISGMEVDNNALVSISNSNSLAFLVTVQTATRVRTYRITGNSGSRVAALLASDTSGVLVTNSTGGVEARLRGAAGTHRAVIGASLDRTRWRMSLGDSGAESGNDAGSDFALAAYTDAGSYKGAPVIISRSSLETALLGLTVRDPARLGVFTLSTLPNPALYTNYVIMVSNANGGPKLCYSNGSNWRLINTSTNVS